MSAAEEMKADKKRQEDEEEEEDGEERFERRAGAIGLGGDEDGDSSPEPVDNSRMYGGYFRPRRFSEDETEIPERPTPFYVAPQNRPVPSNQPGPSNPIRPSNRPAPSNQPSTSNQLRPSNQPGLSNQPGSSNQPRSANRPVSTQRPSLCSSATGHAVAIENEQEYIRSFPSNISTPQPTRMEQYSQRENNVEQGDVSIRGSAITVNAPVQDVEAGPQEVVEQQLNQNQQNDEENDGGFRGFLNRYFSCF